MIRRNAPMKRSRGTSFPPSVVAHVLTHQEGCIGPDAGMPGECAGRAQNDHVRASHAIGMKSKSIATNCARLCGLTHHPLKTDHAEWRLPILAVIARLHGECAQCQRESIETWGVPLEGIR